MVDPNTTYRCRHCTQLLPFNELVRVPPACLRRCEGGCDWTAIGPTTPELIARASLDGEVGDDGLPAADGAA